MNPFLPYLLALFFWQPADYSVTLHQADGQELTWRLTSDVAPDVDEPGSVVAVETAREDVDDEAAIGSEVIYKFTFHFSSGAKLVRYRDTKSVTGDSNTWIFTVYKSYKKLANGKFTLEGKSSLSVNSAALDWIEVEEIK